MSDVFAGLVKEGAAIQAQIKAQAQQALQDEIEQRERYKVLEFVRLRNALGLADEPDAVALWEALNPQIRDEWGFALTAYGITGHVYRDLSGWKIDTIPGRVSRETLALFVAWARETALRIKQEVQQALLNSADPRVYEEQHRDALKVNGLWDDPDVQRARVDFLMRTQPKSVMALATSNWWGKTWLEEALVLPLQPERAEVQTLFTRAKAWADFDYTMRTAEYECVDGEHLDALQAEVDAWGDDAPQNWRDILARLQSALEEEKAAHAWDRERARLQAEAFFPFRYYLVEYVYLTAAEDGLYVEVDEIPSLQPPDAEGWLVDARNSSRVQVRAITTVTEVQVRTPLHLPTWPCCWRGEPQRRYQVPPEGAEKL